VVFQAETGRRLEYGQLAAVDAEGRALLARLEAPEASRLRLVVADEGAAYPVVIDPLLTATADAQLESDQKGKLATNFEVCTSDDRKDKVQKAGEKTVQGEAKKCDPLDVLPHYAYTGSAAVNQAAVDGALALLHEIFGNPVEDADLLTMVDDEDAAACQSEMLKQVSKLENAVLKEINKAKKKALEEESVNSVPALAVALEGVFSSDKIAKAEGKLGKGVEKKCASLQDPAVTFPGACADPDLDVIEDCVIAAARCQACLALNAMDNLRLGCDQTDDGNANRSCP
jgi:hypothetical protein